MTLKFSTEWANPTQHAPILNARRNNLGDLAMMNGDYNAPAMNNYGHPVPDTRSYDSNRLPCRCLHNQADLFCSLTEFKHGLVAFQVGPLLEKAPLALAQWKSALQCLHCKHAKNRDVYNMLALGVRVIISMMESAYASKVDSSQLNDFDFSRRTGSGLQSNSDSMSASYPRLQLGLYEVVGEDYTLVANTLLARNIQRIRAIVSCLRDRVDSICSEGAVDCSQHTMATLQTLAPGFSPVDGTEQLPLLARSLEVRIEALLQHLKDR